MKLAIALLLSIAADTPQAQSADGLACIASQLSPEQNVQVATMFTEQAPPEAWLATAIDACVQQHGWSSDARRAAMRAFFGTALRTQIMIEPPLSAEEIARVEQVFASIPEDLQRSWLEVEMSDDGEDVLNEALDRAGIDRTGVARQTFIGHFLLSDHLIRFGRADFAASR